MPACIFEIDFMKILSLLEHSHYPNKEIIINVGPLLLGQLQCTIENRLKYKPAGERSVVKYLYFNLLLKVKKV